MLSARRYVLRQVLFRDPHRSDPERLMNDDYFVYRAQELYRAYMVIRTDDSVNRYITLGEIITIFAIAIPENLWPALTADFEEGFIALLRFYVTRAAVAESIPEFFMDYFQKAGILDQAWFQAEADVLIRLAHARRQLLVQQRQQRTEAQAHHRRQQQQAADRAAAHAARAASGRRASSDPWPLPAAAPAAPPAPTVAAPAPGWVPEASASSSSSPPAAEPPRGRHTIREPAAPTNGQPGPDRGAREGNERRDSIPRSDPIPIPGGGRNRLPVSRWSSTSEEEDEEDEEE